MIFHDIVIVGGGLTGLMAAVEAPPGADVAVISKELQHHIKTIVGISTRVTVLEFEAIPRTQTGKARRLIDERPKQL